MPKGTQSIDGSIALLRWSSGGSADGLRSVCRLLEDDPVDATVSNADSRAVMAQKFSPKPEGIKLWGVERDGAVMAW